MTNNDDLAMKTRKDFEAYYNETHSLKATSQFKRFGYYVSPTMQKAWELWQAAQSSLLAERDADKKRIAELESRTVSVKLPDRSDEMFWSYTGDFKDEKYQTAVIVALTEAGIKLEVGE
jgi:hypothetical protein